MAEVLVMEVQDRFVKVVITVVDTGHFQPNKGSARAMQDIME